jgi:glycosyltransferase involved in cell wall biosynthesis
LKLAWVTPINTRSAIGRTGVETAEALAARGHAVEIWASEFQPDPDEPAHPTSLPVRRVDEIDLEHAGVDLAIVNIGDNFLFHAGGLEVLERVPSVGVFHDVFLHNLFVGWLWGTDQPPHSHQANVEALYGKEAGKLSAAAHARELPLELVAERLPMTEWVARRCQGALAHADFYRPRLEAACPGPVDTARLPWKGRTVPPLPRRRRERLELLTVGVMNPNKCGDAVIEAIGVSAALRGRARYVLAGPIEDGERARLQSLAEARGVDLVILGPVDDAELETRLAEADILVCLRKPVLEGASASAIEAMQSGRPTLVADAGFYAELPDELVVKSPPAVLPADIAAALERLAADEPLRRRMGEAASAWAAGTFTTERYLDVLEPLIQAAAEALPKLRTAQQLGRSLARMGLSGDDPAAGRALHLLASLGVRPTEPLAGA